MLNAYLAEHMGEEFTAKDFRTWGGTLTAAIALAEQEPPAPETEARRVLASVMRRVARELGNTPAVARASYVSPVVVERWREGLTLRLRDRARHRLGVPVGLVPEERALLRLLKLEAR